MHPRVAPVVAATLVGLAPPIASAIDERAACSVIGVTAVDTVHARAGDVLAFEIALGSRLGTPYDSATQLALARISGTTDLRLDVVLARDADRFPEYVQQDVVASGTLRPVARPVVRAMLGPFTVGEHEVTTVVRVADDATGETSAACDAKVTSFTVYPDSGLAPVVEFFDAASGRYFVSQDVEEIRALDRGAESGWRRTGYEFLAYRPGQTDGRLQRIARYRGRSSTTVGWHRFVGALSSDALELTLGDIAADWVLDVSDAFELYALDADTGACPPATIPVLALSDEARRERLVTDVVLAERMSASGWTSQRVAWCAVAS